MFRLCFTALVCFNAYLLTLHDGPQPRELLPDAVLFDCCQGDDGETRYCCYDCCVLPWGCGGCQR